MEYLKKLNYKVNTKVERNFSIPDFTIENIAIEIKGPTDMEELKTLQDKISSYLPEWEYLFIVLFDINIVKYKSKDKNLEIYQSKKKRIIENIIDDKKDKVFFIEIS